MNSPSQEFPDSNISPHSADASRLSSEKIRFIFHRRSQQSEIHQAMEIAIHYIRCERLAMDLKDAWALRHSAINAGLHTPAHDEIILQLARQIKELHAADLGIKIEWGSSTTEGFKS